MPFENGSGKNLCTGKFVHPAKYVQICTYIYIHFIIFFKQKLTLSYCDRQSTSVQQLQISLFLETYTLLAVIWHFNQNKLHIYQDKQLKLHITMLFWTWSMV